MNEPNRVLHMSALNAGGIETFIINVYRKIDKNKVIFDFVNYFDPKVEQFYEEEVIKTGSKVYKTGSWDYSNPIKKHIHRIKSLYKILKENDYRVVHIHASDNVWIEDAIVSKIAGVQRIIIHSHNSSIPKQESRYFIKKIFHNIVKNLWEFVATDYLACSELAAEYLYPKKIINSGKVEVIKNGIDIDKYLYNNSIREELREKLNLEGKFVIGHIGRFAYQKNHDYLIDIFYDIKKKYDDCVLLLVGEGELENQIKDKVNKLNISDSVIFFGVSNEIPKLLQIMDVFVLPSHFEGLPLVGVEAQAAGMKLFVSENVSRELNMTDNVIFLPIDGQVSLWSNEILKAKNINRDEKAYINLVNQGYNINDVAKILEKKYINN